MRQTPIAHWTRLGAAVRDARRELGLSQHELAERAKVARSWLAKVEAGHRSVELEPLLRLLHALGLRLSIGDAPRDEESATSRDESSRATTRNRRAAWDALRMSTEASAALNIFAEEAGRIATLTTLQPATIRALDSLSKEAGRIAQQTFHDAGITRVMDDLAKQASRIAALTTSKPATMRALGVVSDLRGADSGE